MLLAMGTPPTGVGVEEGFGRAIAPKTLLPVFVDRLFALVAHTFILPYFLLVY